MSFFVARYRSKLSSSFSSLNFSTTSSAAVTATSSSSHSRTSLSVLRQSWQSLQQWCIRTTGIVIGTTILLEITTHLPSDGRSSIFYHNILDNSIVPWMRKTLDPDVAHRIAITLAQWGFTPTYRPSAKEQHCNMACTLTFDTNNNVAPNIVKANSTKAPPPQHLNYYTSNKPKIRPLMVPNPIGLAAGFDRDGTILQPMFQVGFGLVEIGTVTTSVTSKDTPNSSIQQKNTPETPTTTMKIWSYLPKLSLQWMNLYNINSHHSAGMEKVQENLQQYKDKMIMYQQEHEPFQKLFNSIGKLISSPLLQSYTDNNNGTTGAIGISIGTNRTDPQEMVQDLTQLVSTLGPWADYLVLNVNVSSPSSSCPLDGSKEQAVESILRSCLLARDQLANQDNQEYVPPVFVKLSSDISDVQLESIVALCVQVGVDGFVICSTSHTHPDDLTKEMTNIPWIQNNNKKKEEELNDTDTKTSGIDWLGLSVKDRSTHCIRKVYQLTQGRIPIVGVGGILTGQDIYEKLCAGASLVQVYSTFVYHGPGTISRLRHELADQLILHGHSKSIAQQVVGLDHQELFLQRRNQELNLLPEK